MKILNIKITIDFEKKNKNDFLNQIARWNQGLPANCWPSTGTSCADYVSTNKKVTKAHVKLTAVGTFSAQNGYNYLPVTGTFSVAKGDMVELSQTKAVVGVDMSITAKYSDFSFADQGPSHYKLSELKGGKN